MSWMQDANNQSPAAWSETLSNQKMTLVLSKQSAALSFDNIRNHQRHVVSSRKSNELAEMYTPDQAMNEDLGRVPLHASLHTISRVSLLPGQAAELHQQQTTSHWLFQVCEAYLPCLN